MWRCMCDCGRETLVAGGHLKNAHTSSCVCLYTETLQGDTNPKYKHGQSHTRLYNIWSGMRQRCKNQNNPKYQNYGSRGIRVCDEWDSSFKAFEDWALSNGYDPSLSIDRIDVNGNYCPDNCRWATPEEQSLNRTDNHYLTFNGRTMTMKEWADDMCIPYKQLEYRINQRNMPVEIALKI